MTMRLVLHGGFGEKGRTSVAVETAGFRLLIDAGVKTSARGTREYFPAITPAELAATDVLVVTHGHEDHAAALGYCIEHGFRGRMLMTAETAREAREAHEGYATARQQALFAAAQVDLLPVGGPTACGPFTLTTGRSGHIAGGVWCAVALRDRSFLFCGDVVPQSPVFGMDAMPRADAVALDASYGDDATPPAARAAGIAAWVARQDRGCVLPTPLYGRSAELLAIVPGPLALAPGMREALDAQLANGTWLAQPGAGHLVDRLAGAAAWTADMPLPRAALLCHDGMGLAGPARGILARARVESHPTLFTGHVPEGSPGAAMVDAGLAEWIRLPTHPTLAENRSLAAAVGARVVLGHSCDRDALARLAPHIPGLRVDAVTGDRLELPCAS